MKTPAPLLFSIIFILIKTPLNAQDEPQAIREVIKEAYVDGIFNEGNLRNIELGFHPDFRMTGVLENGEFFTRELAEWKQIVKRDQAAGMFPPPKNQEVKVKYLDISIEGNTAVAKLEFWRGHQKTYIDFLTLHKFGRNWLIVAKAFEKLEGKGK